VRRELKARKAEQAQTAQMGDAPKKPTAFVAPVAENPAKVAKIADAFGVNGETTTGTVASLRSKMRGFLTKKPDQAISALTERVAQLEELVTSLATKNGDLLQENAALKAQIAELTKAAPVVATVAEVAPVVAAVVEAPVTEAPVVETAPAAKPAISMQEGISALATGTVTVVEPVESGLDLTAAIGEAVKEQVAAVKSDAAEPAAETVVEPAAEVAAVEPAAEMVAEPATVVTFADRADAARGSQRKPARGGAGKPGGKPAKVATGGPSRPHHVVKPGNSGPAKKHI
jgi:hypothetical protein